jgi:hypothetical protein
MSKVILGPRCDGRAVRQHGLYATERMVCTQSGQPTWVSRVEAERKFPKRMVQFSVRMAQLTPLYVP